MTTLTHRDRRFIPEIFDLLDNPLFGLRTAGQTVRFEDYVKDDAYVLRAELPGVDPAKDVEVTVTGDVLTIHAERHQDQKEAHRSEFRYGSLTRSITLPPTAKKEGLTAVYDKGVLEITVQLAEPKQAGTRVPITVPKPAKS